MPGLEFIVCNAKKARGIWLKQTISRVLFVTLPRTTVASLRYRF